MTVYKYRNPPNVVSRPVDFLIAIILIVGVIVAKGARTKHSAKHLAHVQFPQQSGYLLHMYYSQKNVIRIEVLHYLYNYG
jgi:hypothetical protein